MSAAHHHPHTAAHPHHLKGLSLPPHAAHPHYGATAEGALGAPAEGGKRVRRARSSRIVWFLASFAIPVLVFVTVFFARSFQIRYDMPMLANVLCAGALSLVLCLSVLWCLLLRSADQLGISKILGFLCVTSLFAWLLGCAAGEVNYWQNLQPFYAISDLNSRSFVDPALFRGQQLMDTAQMDFVSTAHLDISKSVGFRDANMYCVAPVVSGNTSLATYDFWAVGLNCCSGHIADFHCGEYNRQGTMKGLRLMREQDKPYYRLAVKEAEVAYNIKSENPIFLYWLSDPLLEVNAHQDHGYRYFVSGVFGFISFQLVLTVIAVGILSKL